MDDLDRNEVESRVVARVFLQPKFAGSVDPAHIDNKKLREAVRLLKRLIKEGKVTEDATLSVLEAGGNVDTVAQINRICDEHIEDNPESLPEYLAILAKGRLPSPVSLAEMAECPPDLPPVLIEGLLYRSAKLLLTAGSKGRKSWLLMHLGMSISTGNYWMGWKTNKCGVLFLNLELFPGDFYRRADAIRLAMGFDVMPKNFHAMHLRGKMANLSRIKEHAIEFSRENDVGCIVADPFYKLGGADELNTSEIGGFLNELEAVASESGAATVMSHHHTKGDSSQKNVLDLASGSGVFARDCDAFIGMRELKDSTDDEPLVRLDTIVRSFRPVSPMGLRWDFPIWRPDSTLDLELKQPGKPGRPVEHTVADIVKVLGNRSLSVGEWSTACTDEIGLQSRRFATLKKKAVLQGVVEELLDGRKVLCRAISAKTDDPIIADIKQQQTKEF